MFGRTVNEWGVVGTIRNLDGTKIVIVTGHESGECASLRAARQRTEETQQRLVVDGLGQVVVKACLSREVAVPLLPIAGQGDETRLGHARELSHLFANLISTHVRQADIEQDDLRYERRRCFERASTVERHADLMSGHAKQLRQSVRRVLAVIDDQDSARDSGRRCRRLHRVSDITGLAVMPKG
jgi:hypothetical protein